MSRISFSESGPIVPATPLRDIPAIAARVGTARVLVKLENERPYGNFKILGGMYAGLRLLAERAGTGMADLVDGSGRRSSLPRLVCASAGNHGLAVAAAARAAGAVATVFLQRGANPLRVRRIEALGAAISWVNGTYDDAVDAAVAAAKCGDGLLVPDTTADPDDPAVQLVMTGYSTIARELSPQLDALGARLSHGFLQAGVGGLAAAVAQGLHAVGQPAEIMVVEPESAPCVGRALANGGLQRVEGDLRSIASMLSCGVASAPAVEILRRRRARALTVGEAGLADAVGIFADAGIPTTPSGAAGLAGLLRVAADTALRDAHGLSRDGTVLLIVTEAAESDG